MEFTKGTAYSRQEIRKMVGGGSVHDFLPYEGGKVLCACLSREHVAGGEMVVLVGAGVDLSGREAESGVVAKLRLRDKRGLAQ